MSPSPAASSLLSLLIPPHPLMLYTLYSVQDTLSYQILTALLIWTAVTSNTQYQTEQPTHVFLLAAIKLDLVDVSCLLPLLCTLYTIMSTVNWFVNNSRYTLGHPSSAVQRILLPTVTHCQLLTCFVNSTGQQHAM